MHIGRTDPSDEAADRLVALDERDVHDLQRILGKLRQCPADADRPSESGALEDKARSLLEDRRRRADACGFFISAVSVTSSSSNAGFIPVSSMMR